MVAFLRFKDESNDKGEAEIGCGTYEEHQGKGFMTEAVKAITEWGLNQKNLKAIIACYSTAAITSALYESTDSLNLSNLFIYFC